MPFITAEHKLEKATVYINSKHIIAIHPARDPRYKSKLLLSNGEQVFSLETPEDLAETINKS